MPTDPTHRHTSLREVWTAVEAVTGVTFAEFVGRSVQGKVSPARKLFAVAARDITGASFPELAAFAGRRTHSSCHTAFTVGVKQGYRDTDDYRRVCKIANQREWVVDLSSEERDLDGLVTVAALRRATIRRRTRWAAEVYEHAKARCTNADGVVQDAERVLQRWRDIGMRHDEHDDIRRTEEREMVARAEAILATAKTRECKRQAKARRARAGMGAT